MRDFFENPGEASALDINIQLCKLADGNFIRARRLGRSVCSRSIISLEIGSMVSPVVFVGGTHGMEWASALIALKLACETAKSIKTGNPVHGIGVQKALSERGAVFVPLLNPDGYEIRRTGRGAALKKTNLLSRFEDAEIMTWQSNANGVDINHNFNAGFYKARRQVRAIGIKGPAPTRYGGPMPFSEPESRAIKKMCAYLQPRSLYSLHSQGEEIYWRYGKSIPERGEYIAKLLAGLTGYELCEPDVIASHAGLKDWFIKKYGLPGFTIELGLGKNPLPYEDFDGIWQKTERALFAAMII